MSNPQYLQAGTSLQGGKYIIINPIGHGGFGITYYAKQYGLERKVAIKEFYINDFHTRDGNNLKVSDSDKESFAKTLKSKFYDEARTIATLQNPHIVHIYDVFEENETVYYAMELLQGGSLKDIVESNGPMAERQSIEYVTQIAEAVYFIHSKGYLHLDIKPSNILLNSIGEAVLIDFGISKHFYANGNNTVSILGASDGFSPLEQYSDNSRGHINKSSDVYSLSATLLYLLSGKTPDSAPEICIKGEPKIPINISPRVAKAIKTGMSPKASNRPADMVEFVKSLGRNINKLNASRDSEETIIISNRNDTSKANHIPTKRFRRPIIIGIATSLVLTGITFLCLKNKESIDDIVLSPADIIESEIIAPASPDNNQSTISSNNVTDPNISKPRVLDLGYAVYAGAIHNGKAHGEGKMTFSKPHLIDSRDPEHRTAEPGDWVEGMFDDGSLVQGNWFDKNGNKKGFIMIGIN